MPNDFSQTMGQQRCPWAAGKITDEILQAKPNPTLPSFRTKHLEKQKAEEEIPWDSGWHKGDTGKDSPVFSLAKED